MQSFRDGSAPVFRACASAMQRPTLTNVRIRSTRDANQIFYAVARNLLPMTVRRLDAEERRAISSGNVYVWEERGASSEATGLGIERWTDGMRWSPSRVRDEFLFYHQKELDPEEAADLPPTRWARIVRPKTTGSEGASPDSSPEKIPSQRSTNDPERLIKQTYSVLVTLPEDCNRGIQRKWHLTAYFTQATVDQLSTVDEMLPQPHVPVPEGWFRSARAGKSRRDTGQRQQPRQVYGDSCVAGPSNSTTSPFHGPSTSQRQHYSIPTPHAQYTGYPQHPQDTDIISRMDVDPGSGSAPPPRFPPVTYSVTPPVASASSAPPYPHPQRGVASDIVYAPREPETRIYNYDSEKPTPPRGPLTLPNTYDPSSAGPSASSPPPYSQVHTYRRPYPHREGYYHDYREARSHREGPRSPSYLHPYSHPYAHAYPSHLSRMNSESTPRPSSTIYYQPAQPLPSPIEASVSPIASNSLRSRPLYRTEERDSCCEYEYRGESRNHLGLVGVDSAAAAADVDTELGRELQRESNIGKARAPSSPSPRNRRISLLAPTATAPALVHNLAPRSGSPRSATPVSAESASGSILSGPGVAGTSMATHARTQTQTTDYSSVDLSPSAAHPTLVEERQRSLVPLDSLENAISPRRDPNDDALLRKLRFVPVRSWSAPLHCPATSSSTSSSASDVAVVRVSRADQ